MAKTTTLPKLWWPLMEAPSCKTPYCCVCGKTAPLNQHHVVKRSAGNLYRAGVKAPKPTVTLCGSGTTGCHGLAHENRLHFRWHKSSPRFVDHGNRRNGHWEYLLTDEPVKYQKALEMDGWEPVKWICRKREVFPSAHKWTENAL